jgi:hypothetical protein
MLVQRLAMGLQGLGQNDCFDDNGNAIPCAGATPGTTIVNPSAPAPTVSQCVDTNGNTVACPSGVSAGSVVVAAAGSSLAAGISPTLLAVGGAVAFVFLLMAMKK